MNKIHYSLISRCNLHLVCVCMTEVPPLFVVEFLHRVVETFEDYFGECSESAIKVIQSILEGGVLLVLYFKQCVSYRFYVDDHYVFTRWVSMPRAYFFFNMLLAEFGKLKDLFWCILGWKNLPFVWFFSQISFPPGGRGGWFFRILWNKTNILFLWFSFSSVLFLNSKCYYSNIFKF